MKDLKLYLESLLDDEDALAYNPIEEIQRFLTKTYGKHVSFKIKKGSSGIYVVTPGTNTLSVEDPDAVSLTNGLFRFSPELDKLNCYNCTKLQSLEGCPGKCGCIDCRRCTSLKTLEGAPTKVPIYFMCDDCSNLKTLKGAPKECWRFSCSRCDALTDLTGAPQKCNSFFL